MLDLVLKISPVILAFVIGVGLRHFAVLTKSHADKMLRLVVYVGLPALILTSINRIELTYELGFLPLAAALILLGTWPIVVLAGRVMRLPRPTLGAFVIGPMTMNMAFVFPFTIVAWGAEGFAIAALFDFGNAIVILTLVYGLSCWYGADQRHWLHVLKKILTFPPFIALSIALLMNVTEAPVPSLLMDVIHEAGRVIILLVPVALGIYFNPRISDTGAVAVAVVIRIGFGLLFGFLWVEVFDLQGLARAVVLFSAAAPIGFNTLVFASQHHLNKEFAASIASVSLIMGIFYLPLMLYLLD